MFNSKEFVAMQSSLRYLSMKQQIIGQNLANYSTPGYKTKGLSFEEVLTSTQTEDRPGKYAFRAKLEERSNTVARPDGNNVDSDAESLELYQTYLQSSYLTQKINGEIQNTRYVIKQAFK